MAVVHRAPDELLLEHRELDGQGLSEWAKGRRPLRERQRERLADAADLEELQAPRRALGLDLELPIDPERRRDPRTRGLGDEDLAPRRERLEAPGQVHVGPDRGVFRAAERSDVADDHAAGVDPDAHLELNAVLRG